MKPLNKNPLVSDKWNARNEKIMQEIDDFVEAGCEWAEVWYDDTVNIGRSAELYRRKIFNKYGVKLNITVHQHGNHMYLHRSM